MCIFKNDNKNFEKKRRSWVYMHQTMQQIQNPEKMVLYCVDKFTKYVTLLCSFKLYNKTLHHEILNIAFRNIMMTSHLGRRAHFSNFHKRRFVLKFFVSSWILFSDNGSMVWLEQLKLEDILPAWVCSFVRELSTVSLNYCFLNVLRVF